VSEETPAGDRTYESATARLDEIIHRLDSGEAQLRETLELCEEAKGLIEYCAGELAAVDQGLKELKLEDLATSLTGTAGSSSTTGSDAAQEPSQAAPPEEESTPPPADTDVPF
jgi:exodeoxyribonuclease VII small subunit